MAPSLSKEGLQTNHSTLLSVALQGSTFFANSHPILTHVPSNITASPSLFASEDAVGCFVGFNSDYKSSRHVLPIGKLRNIRFMSIFRFKVWWTTHWTGNTGKQVENETQMMLLDKNDVGRPYVLLLPLLEGPFRASLQSGKDDDVDICVESGSNRVCSSSFRSVLYIHVGNDPFQLVKDAVKVIRAHNIGTFKLLDEKCPPGIIDKFGWCTWDAFYLKVHPRGVYEGVKGLVDGGCPPGMVLIDDGWQSICHDEDDPTDGGDGMKRTAAGEQMPCRLVSFEENYKFKQYKSSGSGMGGFVRDLKEEFKSVEYVYVWHALCGYWGGVRPLEKNMPESKVITPKLSEGLEKTMEDLAVDKIVSNGVGLVPPKKVDQMYQGLHSHLQNAGIDGVKVDVIQLLEMLPEEFGGRVELAKAYYKALTASVNKHFKGNGVIASMEHCNDFMFLGTEAISLGRVGDDFWCTDPAGDPDGAFWLQGCHMVHCAYNSLWMANFIHPDWDMFQSTHPCAAFHAASRAISGGPVYVSDSVGEHNFDLLKTLVLPDGSILRCQHYALPTRDCLFEDPLHNGKTALKIWNLNKSTGVLGAFNCQGGGWCPGTRRNKRATEFCSTVTCLAGPKDVEWKQAKHPIPIQGAEIFAVYMYQEKKLKLLKSSAYLEISLHPFGFELLTISPVNVLPAKSVQFAPIGLVNMLNSGGAIQSLVYNEDESMIKVEVNGHGEMKAFASEKPMSCLINGINTEFSYEDSMVTIYVPWPKSFKLTVLEFMF